MASREASVRVTLSAAAFKAGMKKMVASARKSGAQIKTSLRKPIAEGVKGAKKELASLGSSIKDNLKTAATFGGAFAVGALAKGAIDAQSQYKKLAIQFEKFNGTQAETAEIQERVERVASDSKVPLQQVRDTFHGIVAVVKDLDDAEDAMKRINLQSKRLGVEPELVARSFTRLKQKTGKSNEEIELMIEQFERFGRTVLGIDIDEAIDPNDIAEFSAFANRAGLSIQQSLGLVQQIGGEGFKDLGEAGEIIEEIAINMQNFQAVGDLRKKLRLSPEELNSSKGAIENLATVLEKGGAKGVKTLLESFGNERTKDALRKLIGEELVAGVEQLKVSTREEKENLKQSIRDRAQQMQALANSQHDSAKERARIEKANARITTGTSATLQDSLNKLEEAFNKPEVLAALDKLAENLPALAEAISSLVEFVVNQPLLAAGLAVGGKAALGGMGGFFPQLLEGAGGVSGIAKGGISMSGRKLTQAGEFILRPFPRMAARFGATMGAQVSGSMLTKAGPIGAVLGSAVAGVAIGAFTAHKLSEAADEKAATTQKTSMQAFAKGVSRSSTLEEKKAALAKIEARIAQSKDEKSFFASIGEGVTGIKSGEQRAIDDAELDAQKLRRIISRLEEATKTAADGMVQAGEAGKSAAGKMRQIPEGGGKGGNLPGLPGVTPGSAQPGVTQ